MAKQNDADKAAKKKKKKKKKKGGGGLSPEDRKTIKQIKKTEKKLGTAAKDIVGRDVERGIDIGKSLAPDVTDEDFLDRIVPARETELNTVIDKFDENRARALADSEEAQFVLDTLKQKAETGFTPQERERVGFEARQGLSSQLATGLRAAKGFNLGRNISGGFESGAFNPVLRQFVGARRGIENDILLAEQAEKNRALTEFGGLVERRDQNRVANTLNIDTAQGGLVERDRGLQSNIDQFNAAQRAKEIAARTARNTTGVGLIQDERDILRQEKLLRDQLRESDDNLAQLLAQA